MSGKHHCLRNPIGVVVILQQRILHLTKPDGVHLHAWRPNRTRLSWETEYGSEAPFFCRTQRYWRAILYFCRRFCKVVRFMPWQGGNLLQSKHIELGLLSCAPLRAERSCRPVGQATQMLGAWLGSGGLNPLYQSAAQLALKLQFDQIAF